MSSEESHALVGQVLDYLQSRRRFRVAVGAILVALLVAYGVHSLYQVLPRRYTLTISGGGIVSNRHYLAHVLAKEAAKNGLTLVVKPLSGGMLATLEDLGNGKVDVAVVQGGLEET